MLKSGNGESACFLAILAVVQRFLGPTIRLLLFPESARAAEATLVAATATVAVVSESRSRFTDLSSDKVELGGLLSKDDVIETSEDEGRKAKLEREPRGLPFVVVPLVLLLLLLLLVFLRLLGT